MGALLSVDAGRLPDSAAGHPVRSSPSSPAVLLPPPSSVLTGGPPPSSPLLAPVLARAGAPRRLGFRDPPRLHLPNPPAEGIEAAPRLFAAAVALPRPRSAVAPPPPPRRPAPPRPGITPAAHSAHLWTGAEGRVLGGRRPLEVRRSWAPAPPSSLCASFFGLFTFLVCCCCRYFPCLREGFFCSGLL